MSDPDGSFRELVRGDLKSVKEQLGWAWWDAQGQAQGDGFEWLEKQRKTKKKENLSSMYM